MCSAQYHDWIDDLVDRGILSSAQADAARKAGDPPEEEAADLDEASASSPLTFSRPVIFSCGPCGKVYSMTGWDTSSVVNCPHCRSPLRLMEVGALNIGSPAGHKLVPGKKFGRYVLRRELGRGGMGVVYEAHDTALDRTVALKMLGAAGEELVPEAVERLKREARAAGKLKHPSIVAVYDVDEFEGRHYFTMDLVEGSSFDAILRRDAAMREVPMLRRVEMLLDVADALACAHSEGIVHRDVKPSNVMLENSGRGMLLDFGLAREMATPAGAPLTQSNVIVGTPEFMAPEQATGTSRATGPAGDVFSFGSLLYTVLTGKMPFTGTNAQVLYAIVHSHPEPPAKINPDIPADLQTICLRCLEKDPESRFPHGSSLAAEIRRFLSGHPIESKPASWLTRFFRNFARKTPPLGETPLKFGTATAALVASARALSEAMVLFEQARPALESAWRYVYDPEASHEELVRRVEVGQRAIEEGLAKAPEAPLGHYLLGRAWEVQGWDEKAEGCWREALRLEPGLAAARFHLGRLLMERAFLERMAPTDDALAQQAPAARQIARQAQAELDKAMAKGSGLEDELQRRVAEAMASFVRGELFEVAELCRQGVADFPTAPGREDFWWVLAHALKGSEKARALDEAIRIRPRHAMARFSRGGMRLESKLLAGAIEDFTEALRIKPRFVQALTNRASALRHVGRLDEARKDVDEAVRLDPASIHALACRGVVRNAQGDVAGALQDFRTAIAADKRADFTRIMLIRALIESRQFEQALGEAETAIAIRPDVADLWSYHGYVLLELGRAAESERSFDEAIQRDRIRWGGFLLRAQARMHLGRWADAEEDLIQVLDRAPAEDGDAEQTRGLMAKVRENMKTKP